MLTAGDEAIDKVLAVMPDGKTGAPCGACRELMVQLMPKSYKIGRASCRDRVFILV